MAAALEGVRIHVGHNALAGLGGLQATARPSTARHVVRPHPSFRQALNQRLNTIADTRPALDTAKPTPAAAPDRALYTVRPGDTLSAIVGRALASQGRASDPAAVQQGVRAVSGANGIDNPNRIFPGQQINLSPLSPEIPIGGQGGPAPGTRRVGLSAWLGGTERLEGRAAERIERILAPKETTRTGFESILGAEARLSSGYGMRKDPFTGERAFHAGVDFAAAPGTPIHALRDGEVVFSGWQSGYGRTVIVRHDNGLESVYAHNRTNHVRVGDRVTPETLLGEVGSSGRSTGPHLHFEVRKHGRPVNPMPYLQATALAKAG